MNVMVDCPQGNAGEWRFSLFGTEVRVKFWFWIAVAVMCGAQETSTVMLWVAVCLVSILIHEFGHVAALRWCGTGASVVLYGWGGLTAPRRPVRGTLPEFVVALAGPAAGFAVTMATMLVAMLTGGKILAGWHIVFPVLTAVPAVPVAGRGALLWYALLNDLLWVNFYWGLVNLLPVLPLDGGHAAQAVLEQRDGYSGRRTALWVSAVVAAAVAVLAFAGKSFYLSFGFLVLAVSSAQAAEGMRASRPSQRWRE